MNSTRPHSSRLFAAFAAAALLLPIAGCHSKTAATPENFTTGLNAYFAEHAECLFPGGLSFPYETSDPAKTAHWMPWSPRRCSTSPSITPSTSAATPRPTPGQEPHPLLLWQPCGHLNR